jgi:hypothetical protein
MKKIIFIILAIITYSINAQNILTSGGIPVKSNSHILSSYDLPYKTDLIAWYHGDKGVKLDANRVYQLDDLSGNNRNLTQSTSSYQPTWATGTNGRGYIQFDGSNDYLGTFNFYDALPANKYNWAIYMVIDDWSYGNKTCGGLNTDGKVFLALHSSNSLQTSIRPCTNGISAGWRHNSGGATWSSNTVTESTKVIIYVTATTTGSGGKVSLQVNNINGTDVQGGSSPYAGTNSFILGGINATLNSSFKLYELIVFGNKPDAANKIKLDRYLSSKYSISIAGVEDIPIKDYYIESILRNVRNLGVYGAKYIQPITIPYTIEYCNNVSNAKIDKYLIYDVANIITPYCIINNINTYCRNSCWKYTTNYSDLLFNSDSSKVALIVDTSITCGYFPDMSLINEAVILDSTNFYN